jgi:hypothetical protein
VRGDEVVEVTGRLDPRPVGHRETELGESLPHQQLVLGEPQGIGAGMHRHARVDECVQHVLRYVLVVERHHVDVAGEREHRFDVGVVADSVFGEHRRHALCLGEHSQVDSELDGGGDHHSGQLPTTDHSDPHPYAPFALRRLGVAAGRLVQSMRHPAA